ncbi:hypothetical protein vBAbaPP1_30 [Acinetobacter phage vB_AbaM_P1]
MERSQSGQWKGNRHEGLTTLVKIHVRVTSKIMNFVCLFKLR